MITLKEFMDEKVKLPSPTAIALRILEAIRKDEDSFSELAETIKSDPALTTRVLKVANSALYSLPSPVNSPAQAISVIGTQSLKNIALSFVIIDGFQSIPQGGFDLNLFWRRAITSAVAAETLAEYLHFKWPDIFVTALLQDIGVLALFLSYGSDYTGVLDSKRISGKNLCEEETRQFGFHHAEVASEILRSWNLPETIYQPIRMHHQPHAGNQVDAAGILNLADKISSMYHGTHSNKKWTEVQSLLKDFSDFSAHHSNELIDRIGEKALKIITLFDIPSGEMKPFSQIMQEANDELRRLNYSYEQIVLELTQAKRNAEQLAVELKKANDSLRELTFRDGLTSLYNHRFFQDALDTEIKRALRYRRSLSLLMLDIDHFKNINDTYGHPVGDQVLSEISALLVRLVRHSDIVARYGGEEFALILTETDSSRAKVLAQRLRRGVEQHVIVCDQGVFSVTVSIGMAGASRDGAAVSRKSLISQADNALYAAKRNGRNRIELYDESMLNVA